MALAESMCYECVPVVINNAALPEVVGVTGFYVPCGDPEATAETINEALKSEKWDMASDRIEQLFSLKKREKKLIGIIENI